MASGRLISADKLKQIAVTYKTRLFPVEKQEPLGLINDSPSPTPTYFFVLLGSVVAVTFLIFLQETLTQDILLRRHTRSRREAARYTEQL